MDDNKINSIVDDTTPTVINDKNTQDIASLSNHMPTNPEGLPVSINTATSENETSYELHPDLEKSKEVENNEPEPTNTKEPETPSKNNIPLDTTPKIKETNIVDKTTNQYPTHELDTIDRLSKLADEDEKDFINSVRAAHDDT